jgi:hypothetical protein
MLGHFVWHLYCRHMWTFPQFFLISQIYYTMKRKAKIFWIFWLHKQLPFYFYVCFEGPPSVEEP